jgi:hypothetical protein
VTTVTASTAYTIFAIAKSDGGVEVELMLVALQLSSDAALVIAIVIIGAAIYAIFG